MKPTDTPRADILAATLFDEQICRLAHDRQTAGAGAYFPLAPSAAEDTYYGAPTTGGTLEGGFEFPGGGEPAALIDALAARWRAEGNAALAGLAPRLKEIAAALQSERSVGDGTVDILCYTMF